MLHVLHTWNMTKSVRQQIIGFTDLGDLSLFDRDVFEEHFEGIGWHLMTDLQIPTEMTPDLAGENAMAHMTPMLKAVRETMHDECGSPKREAAQAWKRWVLALIARAGSDCTELAL